MESRPSDWSASITSCAVIKEAIKQIQSNDELPSLPLKEQSLYAAEVFQKIADRRNIKLKLMKKSSNINPPQTAKHK